MVISKAWTWGMGWGIRAQGVVHLVQGMGVGDSWGIRYTA